MKFPVKILQGYWSLNGESSQRLGIEHESIQNFPMSVLEKRIVKTKIGWTNRFF